jgi:hypothetical protein
VYSDDIIGGSQKEQLKARLAAMKAERVRRGRARSSSLESLSMLSLSRTLS